MRLIDADEFESYLITRYGGNDTGDEIIEDLYNQPAVDAVERKRGRWRHYEGYLTCSECGMEYDDDLITYCGDDVPKFCPNCGADMRGEANDAI